MGLALQLNSSKASEPGSLELQGGSASCKEGFHTLLFLLKLVFASVAYSHEAWSFSVLCHGFGTLSLCPGIRGGSLDLFALDDISVCRHAHCLVCPANPATFCYLSAMFGMKGFRGWCLWPHLPRLPPQSCLFGDFLPSLFLLKFISHLGAFFYYPRETPFL